MRERAWHKLRPKPAPADRGSAALGRSAFQEVGQME